MRPSRTKRPGAAALTCSLTLRTSALCVISCVLSMPSSTVGPLPWAGPSLLPSDPRSRHRRSSAKTSGVHCPHLTRLRIYPDPRPRPERSWEATRSEAGGGYTCPCKRAVGIGDKPIRRPAHRFREILAFSHTTNNGPNSRRRSPDASRCACLSRRTLCRVSLASYIAPKTPDGAGPGSQRREIYSSRG